jgi:hypothetical protein
LAWAAKALTGPAFQQLIIGAEQIACQLAWPYAQQARERSQPAWRILPPRCALNAGQHSAHHRNRYAHECGVCVSLFAIYRRDRCDGGIHRTVKANVASIWSDRDRERIHLDIIKTCA